MLNPSFRFGASAGAGGMKRLARRPNNATAKTKAETAGALTREDQHAAGDRPIRIARKVRLDQGIAGKKFAGLSDGPAGMPYFERAEEGRMGSHQEQHRMSIVRLF